MHIPACVNFQHLLQDWDGFGVNYVETAQTVDYQNDPQDYGGFSKLSEQQRQEILELFFGPEGLRPGVFKMFIDSFQQDEKHLNKPGLGDIDQRNYDHETTTRWMRYYLKHGLEMMRQWGGSMQGIATLYGPPAFMTKIKKLRGRDLDPVYELELAKYIVSFAQFMVDHEGLPLRYIAMHNEGEDFYRWPEDGLDPNIGKGHDYNMYWTPEHVAKFMPLLKKVSEASGNNFMVTPGECSGWTRFAHWGYANAIAEDEEALKAIGLITSHGFYGDNLCERWSNTHADTGIATIRREKPDLHAWVTSFGWKNRMAKWAFEIHRAIYDTGANAIIPWAPMKLRYGWVGGNPLSNCAIAVHQDGTYTIEKGYYIYKHFCRYGQPGMKVAAASCANTGCAVAAFAANGTSNDDAIIVTNTCQEPLTLDLKVLHGASRFHAYRTTEDENFADVGTAELQNGIVSFTFPADSVTTFVALPQD